jgi:hypothetical protein
MQSTARPIPCALSHQPKGTIAIERGCVTLVLLLKIGAGDSARSPGLRRFSGDPLALAGIANAIRVIAHGEGSSVLYVVFHDDGKGVCWYIELEVALLHAFAHSIIHGILLLEVQIICLTDNLKGLVNCR